MILKTCLSLLTLTTGLTAFAGADLDDLRNWDLRKPVREINDQRDALDKMNPMLDRKTISANVAATLANLKKRKLEDLKEEFYGN